VALINKTITVNGKSYSSPEEMPPEVRALYERALEMQRTGQLRVDGKPEIKAHILINGKEAGSMQDLPRPLRWLFSTLITREVGDMLQTPPKQSGGNLPGVQAPGGRQPSALRTLARIVTFALTVAFVYFVLKSR